MNRLLSEVRGQRSEVGATGILSAFRFLSDPIFDDRGGRRQGDGDYRGDREQAWRMLPASAQTLAASATSIHPLTPGRRFADDLRLNRSECGMPSRPIRTRRRLISRARSASWCVLWFCLFTSLWRAPVPCVHIHAPAAGEPRPDVREHVARFHVGEAADDHHGWHVHFVTLREFLRGGGFPVPDDGDERRADEMPVVLSLTDGRPSSAVAAAFATPGFSDWAETSRVVACVRDSGGSLDCGSSRLFAVSPNRRLPLLGIARC
jgi:hypothetical protein